MEDRLMLTWLVVLLVIISLLDSLWALGTFHQNQSGRRKLRSQQGFISIDCGIAQGSRYIDERKILYVSDKDYIDTGTNHNVSKEYIDGVMQQFMTVRSFPEGNRNCYTLRPGEGKDNKYLIRARFRYGNYDFKNQLPTFKLYLGTDEWDTVTIENASDFIRKEIIHVPKTDEIYVCLVNDGSGTPFISTLELRPLDDSIYVKSERGSLLLFDRWDFGASDSDSGLFRPDDDVFDRIWNLSSFWSSKWGTLKAAYERSSLSDSEYKLPKSVMMDASTSADIYEPLTFSINLDGDPSQNLCLYMHFSEVQKLNDGDIREFTVLLNGDDSWAPDQPVIPTYFNSSTLHNPSSVSISTTYELNFTLKRTNRSTLPPIINAMEVYRIKDFSQSSTNQDDVMAVKSIKLAYGLKRHWQGDPCLPLEFPWDGLQCSDSSDSPTIISLNLSSSNLIGNIHHSFSELKSLQDLDLSYNNLTGTIPEFFADLPSLTKLNLTGNNLTGSVPQAVIDKFKDGILSLGGNPNLCQSVGCQGKRQKKKKKNFFVPILMSILSLVVVLILLTALTMIIRKFQRRKIKETVTECPKEGSLTPGNPEFSFSDIATITNNFSRPIGRGGFGHVYLGTLADGTQVAVKVRSQSSMQGRKALRAEAKLLTRVHHKNLVCLIGYCNDGTNMALIYEYMFNGNLQQKLSGREAADVLNWRQRLQIAVDAAHGLEYLHNGCKPPIIHRDMKSSNILLNETLQAKIADFGMSRDLATESGALLSTTAAGTPGYLDPQFQTTGILNKKSDVYSFGIVLLELITGQPAIKNPGSIHVVGWVSSMIERGDIWRIVDPRLQGNFNTNSAWKAVEIALACVASSGIQRPDMSHVLAGLKDCLEMAENMASNILIQNVDSQSIGSINFMEDNPMVLTTQSSPHAR